MNLSFCLFLPQILFTKKAKPQGKEERQRCLQMNKRGSDIEEVSTIQKGQVIPYLKEKENTGGMEGVKGSMSGPIWAQHSYLSDP